MIKQYQWVKQAQNNYNFQNNLRIHISFKNDRRNTDMKSEIHKIDNNGATEEWQDIEFVQINQHGLGTNRCA